MAHSGSDRLRSYSEEIHFALGIGEGPLLRHARERIEPLDWTLEERQELATLDEMVIDEIVHAESIAGYLLQDDPAQPLSHWWWHLGKLRAGTYPADLLPEPLKAIYRQREPAPTT